MKRLDILKLILLEEKKEGRLIITFRLIKGLEKVDTEDLLSTDSRRTIGHESKLDKPS